jgi:hypothetical protein
MNSLEIMIQKINAITHNLSGLLLVLGISETFSLPKASIVVVHQAFHFKGIPMRIY